MTALYRWLTVLSLVPMFLVLFSKWFQKRWYLTEPLTGLALGVTLAVADTGVAGLSEREAFAMFATPAIPSVARMSQRGGI